MKDKAIPDYLYWCADRYLSYRPRTEYELRRYLQRKLIKQDVVDADKQTGFIDATIQRLYDEKRIDDEKFVKMFVDDRQYFRPRGKRRLVLELKQKGIADPLIEDFFSQHIVDELPLIISIIQKKLFFQNHLSQDNIDPDQQKKIINHLLRRGFSYNNIKLAFEEFIKKK